VLAVLSERCAGGEDERGRGRGDEPKHDIPRFAG
jgi:hypothetical protein